jgi:hypothetical protein
MSDKIMDRYAELSTMNVINDMAGYAKDWQRLAYQADIDGRPSTAEACRARAAHYWKLAGGEYIRLIEGCLAELIPTFELDYGAAHKAIDSILAMPVQALLADVAERVEVAA